MQNFYSRESRFSDRVLQAYTGTGLPEVFVVRAATSNVPAEILLYDEIGRFGVSPKRFVQALAEAGDGPITVRINSPGGDPFDGMAIYNALKGHRAPVNVVIDGIAASAASFIAMAGDTIEMHDASMLMIHRASALTAGNAEELAGTIAVLNQLDGTMAAIYAARTGKPLADMMAIMRAETWLTSSEAISAGFATEIAAGRQSDRQSRAAALEPVARAERVVAALRAALPDYDPDGDGDNDAQEALTLITAAMDMLGDAAAALNGTDEEAGGETAANDNLIIAANDNALNANVEPALIFAVAPDEVGQAGVSPANDNEEAESAKAAAHAARLRRLQLARIDVV